MKTTYIPRLHVAIILLALSTPLWLDWRLIILLALLNLAQVAIFDGCVLSQYQFKSKSQGFYKYYIDKYFPKNKIQEKHLDILLDYVAPLILVGIAYYLQH